jgi:AraC-like DNA-binding protein
LPAIERIQWFILAGVDVLADLLTRARARGSLFARSTLRAPWGLELEDGSVPLSVHAVLAGELWAEVDGLAPHRFLQGDLLLVRSDAPYRFVHTPRAPVRPLADLVAAGDGSRVHVVGDAGPETVLLCGAYTFEGFVCDGLLAALPPLVPLPAAAASPGPLRSAVTLLADELGHEAPGQQTVLDRLLDLVLVYALRSWFSRPDSRAPGWFRALDDPAIGPAIRAIHAQPAHAWTVAELSSRAGLSRAAFARRFSGATGTSPLAYLTGWRMTLAREALLRPGVTLAEVAQEVGYAGEFAFAAAFKREVGEAPGRWRAARFSSAA